MRKSTLLMVSLLFLSPLFLVTNAYAEEIEPDVNILDIPYWIGIRLGMSTWQAGILASLIVLFIVMFPLMIVRRGKSHILELILGVGVLCFLTAVGWFPIYGIILIVLLIAGLNAKNIRDVFT